MLIVLLLLFSLIFYFFLSISSLSFYLHSFFFFLCLFLSSLSFYLHFFCLFSFSPLPFYLHSDLQSVCGGGKWGYWVTFHGIGGGDFSFCPYFSSFLFSPSLLLSISSLSLYHHSDLPYFCINGKWGCRTALHGFSGVEVDFCLNIGEH